MRITNIESNQQPCNASELQALFDAYNDADLRLFVCRQAILKIENDEKIISKTEQSMVADQIALLEKASAMKIKSKEDALICFKLWYSETIRSRRSYELEPVDEMLKNVFEFMRQSEFSPT